MPFGESTERFPERFFLPFEKSGSISAKTDRSRPLAANPVPQTACRLFCKPRATPFRRPLAARFTDHSQQNPCRPAPQSPRRPAPHTLCAPLTSCAFVKKKKTAQNRTVCLELVNGIEPSTCSLRMSCSAIEPHQRFSYRPLIIQYLFAIIKSKF